MMPAQHQTYNDKESEGRKNPRTHENKTREEKSIGHLQLTLSLYLIEIRHEQG